MLRMDTDKHGMDRSPLLFLILFGIVLGVLILVYSSVMGTISITERIFSSTDSMNPLKKSISPGYFSINKIRYYDRALAIAEETNSTYPVDRCSLNLTKETMIIELLLNQNQHPENCFVLIESRRAKHFRIDVSKISRMANFTSKQIIYPVIIDEINIYEPHNILVCCEEVCHEDAIGALC